jgi:capsular polysaccharide biosynthesis protein
MYIEIKCSIILFDKVYEEIKMSLVLDLKRTLKAFKKYLWLVIIFFVIGCTASFVNARSHGMAYTASSSFIVGVNMGSNSKVDYYAYAISHQLVSTCNNLLTSNSVVTGAVLISGKPISINLLSDSIQTRISQGSDLISFDVTSNSEASAINLSNALVKSLNNQLSQLDTAIPLKMKVIDMPYITATSGGISSNVKTGLIGGFAGIFVALAIILILTAIKTKEDNI